METTLNVGFDIELLAKSDTKYRDIADGNSLKTNRTGSSANRSDTKYRDIADGNKRC